MVKVLIVLHKSNPERKKRKQHEIELTNISNWKISKIQLIPIQFISIGSSMISFEITHLHESVEFRYRYAEIFFDAKGHNNIFRNVY